MDIGFIGLGIKGTPMALCLDNDDHQVYLNTVGKLPVDIQHMGPKP